MPVVISAEHLEVLEQQEFCGAISLMAQSGLEAYWGRRHAMPLVCINTSPRHLDGIYTVGSNDEQGMRLALDHLLKLGHRRIGRLGGINSFGDPNNWNSYARDRTFRAVMAQHGLPEELYAAPGDDDFADAVKSLLDRGITALIILNEGMELVTLHTLRLLGKRVPEDISLAAFDDILTPAASGHLLCGMQANYERMAATAIRVLRNPAAFAGAAVICCDAEFHRGNTVAGPKPETGR